METIGRRIRIQGTVQGVGFRPWVYRLAHDAGLAGSVRNDSTGVTIEAFGGVAAMEGFLAALSAESPPAAVIERLEPEAIEWRLEEEFVIVASRQEEGRQVSIPPELAVCDDCRREVADSADRRYRYPFTNCTNCGPRFTITLDLPYDRPQTTMAGFVMCLACRREYEDPGDRRFHAQPNACPACGPQLALWSKANGTAQAEDQGQGKPAWKELAAGDQALRRAAGELAVGGIVAVKGLGGFHLMVDARDGVAVARLRSRKARFDKPLALMVRDLDAVRRICELPAAAEQLLSSIEAPIVLLRRLEGAAVADQVAPGHPDLGIMLPYTPLHQLLFAEVDFPLVATSGNSSDEPICIDNDEALDRLGEIADLFLVHDRPIARHADDSVAWIVDGAPALVRRARGYAPAPVMLAGDPPTVLAVGGHLKNTVALNLGRNVLLSQHIGDMETPQARDAFERVIGDLLRMCEAEPVAVAHDLHPEYPSTTWATEAVAVDGRPVDRQPQVEGGPGAGDRTLDGRGVSPAQGRLVGLPLIAVQHHHAHLASCLAEHQAAGPALGVIWDGTGYGTDGTVWGGEFLLGDAHGFERVAHFRPFRLPGGDAAVKAPRRVALALLWELYGDDLWELHDVPAVAGFSEAEARLFTSMLASGLRSPLTTSAGRLFDAVAALADLRQEISYEGQAAMQLEFVSDAEELDAYPLDLGEPNENGALVIDWRPLVAALLADWRAGRQADSIGARFHNALVEVIVQVAGRVGETRVVLSGGCFQNRRLTEDCVRRLQSAGHEVLIHRRVPANDGGISLGQVAVATARLGG